MSFQTTSQVIPSAKGMEFVSAAIDSIPIISIITEIEARCWQPAKKSKESIIQSFIDDSIVLALTPAIVSECVHIRRSKKIKLPDAIIAATAKTHDLTLLSSDMDFAHIDGLKLLDPSTL